MTDQRRLYDELNRALDALRTPAGHRSGAYRLVWEILVEHCPDVYREEAIKSQCAFPGPNGTFGT